MLSKYQVMIDDLYNIPIVNVRKLLLIFFDEQKPCASLWKLEILLEVRTETKKSTWYQ